jgi:hypothetical protein
MKNIHLIQTDKPSRLFIDVDDNKLKICVPLGGEHMMNQNIYITNDEEIKDGEYGICLNLITKMSKSHQLALFRMNSEQRQAMEDLGGQKKAKVLKIILTTDQDLIVDGVQSIDDDFLEWFVKNPSCEEVEVVSNYRVKSGTIEEHKQGVAGYEYYEYKIIIPQEESKQEPIENDEFCYYSGLPSPTAYKNKQTMNKTLILLRGLPGSGKSTLANLIWGEYAICEADKFFYDKEGNYNFDATKLSEAHKWCRNEVEIRMKDNEANPQYYPEIVVSNTSTMEWELESYYKLAEQYGYKVFSLILENRHNGVNTHGVTDDKLKQMKERFEIKL